MCLSCVVTSEMRSKPHPHRTDLAGLLRSRTLEGDEDWGVIARGLCEQALARASPSTVLRSMLALLLRTWLDWEHQGESYRLADPEVFLRLYALTADAADDQLRNVHASLLLVHCHLADADTVAGSGLAFLRLVHSHGEILRLSNGAWSVCASPIAVAPNLAPLCVLMPTNGLFDDFLPVHLYPPYEQKQADSFDLDRVATIESAIVILREYSSELCVNFLSRIRTIALTPPLGEQPRRSFSCRLGYYGAIFADVIPGDVIDTAVHLLHEYCHQQLWSLWFVRPSLAVEENGAVVRSPFTERLVPAPVMAQAYLIYSATLDFLHWIVSSNASGAGVDRAVDDLKRVERRLPVLRDSLLVSSAASSALRELVGFCDQANGVCL